MSNLPVIIARFFNTVGLRQIGKYGMVLPTFVKQALTGKPITIYGDGKQSRSFTYVGDCVRSIMDLMETDKSIGQVYNIGNDKEITIGDLAKRVKQKADSSSEIKYIPYDEAYESGFEDMERRCPDNTKIKQLIGYSPSKELNEIIDLTIEYYKNIL